MNYPTIKLSKNGERIAFWGYIACGIIAAISHMVFHNDAVAFGFFLACLFLWAVKAASIPQDKIFWL